jgi:hypothetical protein
VPHTEAPVVDDGANKLETPWAFWFEHRPRSAEESFETNLLKVGAFNSLEGLWKYVY